MHRPLPPAPRYPPQIAEQGPPDDSFAAAVRVGRGLRPLAFNGALIVEVGQVTLYDGKERVIAQGPVDQVWARKARFPVSGLQLTIEGTRYTLDRAPGWGAAASPLLLGKTIHGTGKLVKAFLDWYPTQGGRVGEPPS